VPSTLLRSKLMKNVRSIVVKVGTALLTRDGGLLNEPLIARITEQLAAIRARGIRVTLVSSGAVGAGIGLTGQAGRPRSVPTLQATAAIGQPALMSLYGKFLARHDLLAGQILVTRKDFEQRSRYVNISNTIAALQRLSALPIINENDPLAVDELDRFADNDTIAAMMTNLLRADLLVILTTVDGLLDENGKVIDLVMRVDGQVRGFARTDKSTLGSGGMITKLGAAKLVADAGEAVVIASGRQPGVLLKLLDGERVGTLFAPASRKMSARHRWMLNAVRPVGQVVIDAGAVKALRVGGKSLLASGIRQVTGKFEKGAIVGVVSPEGDIVAHGLSNFSHLELERIKGLPSSQFAQVLGKKCCEEAIHRNNLVLVVTEV
jgi:glutamate 5-kinase